MADVINFQTEKIKRSSKFSSDPTRQLEDIRDQLMSLNTAFDRLSDTLGEFGTHMHKVSKRLASVEERTTQNDKSYFPYFKKLAHFIKLVYDIDTQHIKGRIKRNS